MVQAVAAAYVVVTVTEDPPCLLPQAFKFPTFLLTRPSLDLPRLHKENSTQQHSSLRHAHLPHSWHSLTVRPHVHSEPPPEPSFHPPPIPFPTS